MSDGCPNLQPPGPLVAATLAAVQCDAEGFFIYFIFLLPRPQGACGYRIISSCLLEKYERKSRMLSCHMLLSRIFFLLLLDNAPFSTEPKGFSELFNFISLCDSVKLALNLEENKIMPMQYY